MNDITGRAAPGPAAPPRNKRVLKTAGTVLGLAAGVVLGRVAMNAVLGDGDGAAADAGRYRLAAPDTFQGLTLQDSGPRVEAVKSGQGPAKPGTTNVAVVYADPSGSAHLVISGAYGRFGDQDPGAALTRTLQDMGKVTGITTQEAGTPAGGAMRCGTLDVGSGAGTLPLCMWADHSTLVTVTVPIENQPVAMDALASQARALRGAMEVPAAS
ncbi:hypothetical protein ACFXA3_23830 [Streptomyces sp. NPDC059456]|uniref:hypothetical protein n=1 Tax=Streptomyces sp. NPDC059456 TaxID=3346838 RepID=UPI0036A901D4